MINNIQPITNQQCNNNINTKKKNIIPSLYIGSAITLGTVGGIVGHNKSILKKNLVKSDKLMALNDSYNAHELTKESHDLREQIMLQVSDLCWRKKENKPTDMPNNVMLVSNDEKYAEHVSDWIAKKGNVTYKKTDMRKEDLLEVLEKAEKEHKKGDWTLLYVKNMSEAINPEKSDDSIIESMKDIMSSSVDDFHTTLIFTTKDPTKLDHIALQPHRVGAKFNLNTVKENDFFAEEKQVQIANKMKKEINKLKKLSIAKFAAIGTGIGLISGFIINKVINKNDKQKNDTKLLSDKNTSKTETQANNTQLTI